MSFTLQHFKMSETQYHIKLFGKSNLKQIAKLLADCSKGYYLYAVFTFTLLTFTLMQVIIWAECEGYLYISKCGVITENKQAVCAYCC